jgi:integrase
MVPRPTCAALLIHDGWEGKDFQQYLGHASYVTTMNVYGHLFESRKTDTALVA